MSVFLGRPWGEAKKKHFFSSHSLLWRNLVCTFWGPEGFRNFSRYYILDWEYPLVLLYFFQQNSSCSHKLRIWPLVSNSTKEDSSTMRQIVLTGFRAVWRIQSARNLVGKTVFREIPPHSFHTCHISNVTPDHKPSEISLLHSILLA